MKKIEAVYREILYEVLEKKKFSFTQSELSKSLGISLSIVNSAIKRLESMGALKINQRGFNLIDIKKILYYWASIRNLDKDIVFAVRIDLSVRELERFMPNLMMTAYSAYKFRFDDVPADYSEIYAYANDNEIEIVKKRISKIKTSKGNPNFFLLKKDKLLELYNKIPEGQIFVDLWNLRQWYAKEFLLNFEKRIL